MTLSSEEKIQLSRYRMEKARRALSDAKNLVGLDAFDASVNRSYYAILSADRSVLILRGIDPETHDGIKTMLSREFIKDGTLPKDLMETFRRVRGRRVNFDYGDYSETGEYEALDSSTRTEEFLKKTSELVNELVKGLE